MAVDKKLLADCIVEAADGDEEFSKVLHAQLDANEVKAAKFVAGFMRTSDYTQKTQRLAEDRKQMGDASAQLETVRKALTAAESEKDKILKDLADNRITTAKARELLKFMQEKYQLTDEDIPGMSDLIATRKTGVPTDSTPDVEQRIVAAVTAAKEEMRKELAGSLIPEIGAMASLPLIWGEIERQHEEFTGKRLTFAEKQEILKSARENADSSRGKGSIYGIWEDKYGIAGDDGLRMQKRDENLKKQWEAERQKVDADRASKAALDQVTPQAPKFEGSGISSAFTTRFKQFETDPGKPPEAAPTGVPTAEVLPGQHVRVSPDGRMPASQRAAQKFIEKGGIGGYRKTA